MLPQTYLLKILWESEVEPSGVELMMRKCYLIFRKKRESFGLQVTLWKRKIAFSLYYKCQVSRLNVLFTNRLLPLLQIPFRN